MIGAPIGVLIGVITGLVVVLMIRTAWRTSRTNIKDQLKVAGEILVIPTFWFGGPWASGKLLPADKPPSFLSDYLLALVCTFVLIAALPLFRILVEVSREISRPGVPSQVAGPGGSR